MFDGHGGKEAAQYCKEHLYWRIVEQPDFWSSEQSKVLAAIRAGFIKCHMDMWAHELAKWPRTPSGLPSTSGTTATILFIKNSTAYVGHVGDSGLVIGYHKNAASSSASSSSSSSSSSASSSSASTYTSTSWHGKKLTRDHKPEDPVEMRRIVESGGSVMTKSGVNRVVWNRPSGCGGGGGGGGTERVPFLAVARSLGDLWSYDAKHDQFVVSPVPDTFAFEIDARVHKCLVLATDGLWNVMRASECVELVRLTDDETTRLAATAAAAQQKNAKKSKKQQDANESDRDDDDDDQDDEDEDEDDQGDDSGGGSPQDTGVNPFVNPSQRLVSTALQRCCEKAIRADNTSCITIMIDEPPNYTAATTAPSKVCSACFVCMQLLLTKKL